MYDQIREDVFFILIYGGVTVMAMMASGYLLLRRGNAFSPGITPPVRLRRWVAALLAAFALNHLWYMPIFFLSSSKDIQIFDLVSGLLDSMTIFPLAIIVPITMLQDRKRPLWPVAAIMAPIVAGGVIGVAGRSYALMPIAYVYFLLVCMGLTVYMVQALRQYGHWLRNNFADLEHKEVWQCFLVLAIVLLVFGIYALTGQGPTYQYAMQIIIAVLIFYLLWRVETLSDLNLPVHETAEEENTSLSIRNHIGPLLKMHCEEPQLYLQYDISLSQLAKAIGTNRLYLSQYFSAQGITYNAYINGLRIRHFIRLYHEAAASLQSRTVQELAYQSGFRSYSTFYAAFKQSMGMTATKWMNHQKASEL